MTVALDLTDKLSRFPVAYSWQPVRGWPVKHFDTVLGQNSQRVKQHALGEGPWDACERLWTDAFEILPADFVFHPGLGTDAADINFPTDPAHPWTAYISAKCQAGLTPDQTDKLFGIYRTLRTANYDGAGQQINPGGGVVHPTDPRTEYFFKPNPANVAVDQLIRWGKRLNTIVNWPAWIDWRDFNDELIPWDDAKYTPRSLSLTPTGGGSLAAGTYYVRVATIRGGDQSSASMKTLDTKAHSITLGFGQTAFQVNWLIKGDEETPATPPGDITGYRVYLGTVAGVWTGYFTVPTPISRTLLVTTLAGITAGAPLDTATAGLMTNIKRFECGLFFIPPYDLATALDRICQISCSDWQWSGLGTNTYRNDKVRFLSPATRAPVFTLNLAETGMGSFKTYPVDRRNRPNQIIVNFRDRGDPYLAEGQPVILDREQLQIDDKQTKPFTIDGGTMYRSQAQRCASFYARVLCDMDQMAAMRGSPKSYHVLPADVVRVTNETPNWTDVTFMVRRKGENVEKDLGDPLMLQIYANGLYSDTDHSPLPKPLPAPAIDPFEEPPPIDSLGLAEVVSMSVVGARQVYIHGAIQAHAFQAPQVLRVHVKKPGSGVFVDTGIILKPDPATLQVAFDYPSPVVGLYSFRVTTESELGASLPVGDHLVANITVLGLPPQVTSLAILRVASDWFISWEGSTLFLPEKYIIRIRTAGGVLLRTHTVQLPDWIPVQWNYHAGAGNQALVNRDPDGSIYMATALDTDFLDYVSQVFYGDVSFAFDVDDRPPFYQIGFWGTGIYIDNGITFDYSKENYIRPEQATFLARRLQPLTRLRIDIRNGQGEYYMDDKLWTRSFQGVATPAVQLIVIVSGPGIGTGGMGPQGAMHCRVRPLVPRQFVYTEEMARNDNAGSLPATMRFDVTQISGAGVESNVATVIG